MIPARNAMAVVAMNCRCHFHALNATSGASSSGSAVILLAMPAPVRTPSAVRYDDAVDGRRQQHGAVDRRQRDQQRFRTDSRELRRHREEQAWPRLDEQRRAEMSRPPEHDQAGREDQDGDTGEDRHASPSDTSPAAR
jgi:hypothetical protein